MKKLTLERRRKILDELPKQQQDFIENGLKRGYRTLFTRFMQSEKISVIKMTDNITLDESEKESDDWTIVDYTDHGLGNRLGKCACGKSLRYEFIVENMLTKKRIKYGKFHLADFLNINVSDINTILYGLHTVDFEADEILFKIQENDYGYEILEYFKDETLPKDIQLHIENNIPLLDRQLERLGITLKKLKNDSIVTKIAVDVKHKVNNNSQYEDTGTYKLNNIEISEIAYRLVLEGEYSATKISHFIRDNYNVNKEYSLSKSGRPRIYPTILQGLHSLAEQGLLYHDVESSGIRDSFFFAKQN